MAKTVRVISAAVAAAVLAGYAVYRTGGFDDVGATTVALQHPASSHHQITVGLGRDEAIVPSTVAAPSNGSGTPATEEQASECPIDGSGPPECNE